MKQIIMLISFLVSFCLISSAFAANTVSCQNLKGTWRATVGYSKITLFIQNIDGSGGMRGDASLTYSEHRPDAIIDAKFGVLDGSCEKTSDGVTMRLVQYGNGNYFLVVNLKQDKPTQLHADLHLGFPFDQVDLNK